MYEDEKQLSREQLEVMYKVDCLGSFFLKYHVIPYIEAEIRPAQIAIDVSLLLLAREGVAEDELSKIEKELSELPVKATAIEGTA